MRRGTNQIVCYYTDGIRILFVNIYMYISINLIFSLLFVINLRAQNLLKYMQFCFVLINIHIYKNLLLTI